MAREAASADEFLLYVDAISPNIRRVEMFLAEKGLTIPTRTADPASGILASSEFLAKNPLGQIPLLEGPNGFVLSESMAICRYLDERFPEPALFGREPDERARIHMWARRAEFQLFFPAVELGHHAHPMFRDSFDQIPAYAAQNRETISRAYEILDAQLEGSPFVAGERFSVADIVVYCGIELATVWRSAPASSAGALLAWKQRIDSRPSAERARYRFD